MLPFASRVTLWKPCKTPASLAAGSIASNTPDASPESPETIFDIASITLPFAALAALAARVTLAPVTTGASA